jgi:hypothetical protein
MDKLEALDRLDDAQSQLMKVHAWLENLKLSGLAFPDFPLYGQQWYPWKSLILGYGTSTIGGYGCVVTSAAMIVSHALGYRVTPGDVNAEMKKVGGFVPGTGLFYFAKLEEAFPGSVQLSHIKSCIDIPAPIDEIDTWLSAGAYVIVRVDFNPHQSGVQSHYIPLISGTGDTFYWAHDTWIGGMTTIPHAYAEAEDWDAARTIYKAVFYSKAP